MTKVPLADILEGLYKSRIRESEKLKTVLELYDLEIHQKKAGPENHRLKTMVKKSIEQDLRNRNFGARNGNYEIDAVVKKQGTKQIWEKCSCAHCQVDLQPSKRSNKNDDKSAAAMLKKYEFHDREEQPVVDRDTRRESNDGPVGCISTNTRQMGCVFQDMEPKLTSILRKSSDMQKPIQHVKFTKAIARHTKIRDQNPSLGLICPGEPHERSPNAPKFEDLSQEETEWQEQGAREAAWKLAKSVLLKEKTRATFFSLSENRCLPASTLKPEEREFVVDS